MRRLLRRPPPRALEAEGTDEHRQTVHAFDASSLVGQLVTVRLTVRDVAGTPLGLPWPWDVGHMGIGTPLAVARTVEPARTASSAAHGHRPSAAEYERRRPEQTVLHQVLSEHWSRFVEHAEEQGRPLPSFVHREVEAYLRCGILEHGLLRLGCPTCGFERLVAFL